MTRMTGPDCAVMCSLIKLHTYIHTYMHAYIHAFDQRFSQQVSLIPPWEDQCEWHRMTRMTGPERGYVQFNKYTYIHTYIHTPRWVTCSSIE